MKNQQLIKRLTENWKRAINPLTNYNYDIKTLIPEDIKEYKNMW